LAVILKNALVYMADFSCEYTDITVEEGRIARVGKSDGDGIDLTGLMVLPGLIDIHIHGFGGADTGDASAESLQKMSLALAEQGVTSFCPTTMTWPYDEIVRILAAVRDCMGNEAGAYIHGANMEGPYLSPERVGAQNPDFVRRPDAAEFRRIYDGCGGIVRLISIAPETEGAEAFIKQVSEYCRVSVAHTDADYSTVQNSFKSGADHVTHLFNAMSGFNHRNPGAVGAVMDMPKSGMPYCEMICDGVHVHPAALRIAAKTIGQNRTVIISDAMSAAGMPDGDYMLGGLPVKVSQGCARLADGTLAGSTTNLLDELKNAVSYGIQLPQAIRSVTINPAHSIGVSETTGSIKTGKSADLLVCDSGFNVKMVIIKGKIAVNRMDNIS
jgi:N-acetylglucosamine-6-phosphate deacetylase